MPERVLMKGNEALAEAAIRAGCRHFFGYPITPQTEVAAYMSKRMPKIGGVYLQAESEIGAINMVLGAAAAGARAMTSSSSPGISLKTEGLSYIAGSDLPCLVINVQRAGPGLGGIQPSQADYWQATRAPGHGDFRILVFAPSTVQEMVDTVDKAFDLADQYRLPAMILADGILGQMMEPVEFKDAGDKALPEKLWATSGHKGQRAHNVVNSMSLVPQELEKRIDARFARYKEIVETQPLSEEMLCDDAELILVAYGATSRVAKAAVALSRAEGLKVGLLRPITLWPFPTKALRASAERAKAYLCVEMCHGQMIDDVRLATECLRPVFFYGRSGGIVPEPREILTEIRKICGGEA